MDVRRLDQNAVRMTRGALLPREVPLVALGELRPLVGELVLGEARVHRAGLDAGVAVDALLGVDVELLDLVVVGLIRRRVDAVDRADLDARVVLGADARLCDHVCHGASLRIGGTAGSEPGILGSAVTARRVPTGGASASPCCDAGATWPRRCPRRARRWGAGAPPTGARPRSGRRPGAASPRRAGGRRAAPRWAGRPRPS